LRLGNAEAQAIRPLRQHMGDKMMNNDKVDSSASPLVPSCLSNADQTVGYDGQITVIRPPYRYKVKAVPDEIQKDFENAWKDLRQGLEKHMDCL
jgi:hypothetical protein